MINDSYFGAMRSALKEGGIKLVLHYQGLKIRELLGYKKFRLKCSNICTENETLTIGEEYQFREGSCLERVIVEKIYFKKFILHVNLFFIDENRHLHCFHTLNTGGYMGMWRIWDIDTYDIVQWKRDNEAFERGEIDSVCMEMNFEKFLMHLEKASKASEKFKCRRLFNKH
ncbi:MAG: hypothetical protein GX467_11080 [Rikenellaceae bacterium]|nr:hypothetical protein [Rikenellaceae bacterium]